MIHINLLPWRENLRKKQYKVTKITLCLLLIISITVLFFLHLVLQQQITKHAAALHNLQQILTSLQKQENTLQRIKKQITAINQQKNAAKQIENNQSRNIELLIALSQINLPLINIDSIQKDNNQIGISGKTISLNALAGLMQKMNALSGFETPTLQEIINRNNNDEIQKKTFSLTINIKNN